MTRKSRARYGLSRTYKINPTVRALRNALLASLALAGAASSAQAACVEDPANVVTCSGAFTSTLDSAGELLVTNPADPASIILDDTTDVTTTDQFGVNVSNSGDLTLVSDALMMRRRVCLH
jgi:hypothetical protein